MDKEVPMMIVLESMKIKKSLLACPELQAYLLWQADFKNI